MARAVKAMPQTPNKENGAKLDRFLSQHRGNKMVVVTASKTLVRSVLPNKELKVSAKTMENARHAMKVMSVALQAGTQLEVGPTV